MGVLERAKSRSAEMEISLSDADLKRLCRSESNEDRLVGLLLVRRQIDEAGPRDGLVASVERLTGDPDVDCMWQAMLAAAGLVAHAPAAVWRIIIEQGRSDDRRVRAAVATALLEPLLKQHYAEYFPLLRERIEQGDDNLRDTLRRCWMFGGAKRHSREVNRLIGSEDSAE